MAHWTTRTPDGRRVVVDRIGDGWTVACGDAAPAAPRERLDVALIEALLLAGDFSLHSMPFDYAAWSCDLADAIEQGTLGPDGAPSA